MLPLSRFFLAATVLLGSCCLMGQAYHEGALAQLVNLCSNIQVRAVASNYNDLSPSYPAKVKRQAVWFGPRMGKREPLGSSDGYEEAGAEPEEFLGSVHGLLKRELEEKLGPDSQWVVYLVNEHPNKYMTPRMGRELSERCLELQMVRPPMGPRMGRNI